MFIDIEGKSFLPSCSSFSAKPRGVRPVPDLDVTIFLAMCSTQLAINSFPSLLSAFALLQIVLLLLVFVFATMLIVFVDVKYLSWYFERNWGLRTCTLGGRGGLLTVRCIQIMRTDGRQAGLPTCKNYWKKNIYFLLTFLHFYCN